MTSRSDGAEITITLSPDLAAALDRHIHESALPDSRETVISEILRDWATAKGYIGPEDGGLRPDQLNAANDD